MESIKKKSEENKQISEQITGLGDDKAPVINQVKDGINLVKGMWQQDEVPIASIEVGLHTVMSLLKKYEDVVLELEPEDIRDIVSSYMALAEEETRSIFDKAAKKKAKTKQTDPKKKKMDLVVKAARESREHDMTNDDWLDDLDI